MKPTSIRLSDDLAARVRAACVAYRQRTGENMSLTGALRVAVEEWAGRQLLLASRGRSSGPYRSLPGCADCEAAPGKPCRCPPDAGAEIGEPGDPCGEVVR